MIETFNQYAIQHPWVLTLSLGGCLVVAFVVLVVWKEIFNLDLWRD